MEVRPFVSFCRKWENYLKYFKFFRLIVCELSCVCAMMKSDRLTGEKKWIYLRKLRETNFTKE